MPPGVTSSPPTWDPVTTASGPCHRLVHRAPTKEVPTTLGLSPLILSFTDGRKDLCFLLSGFPTYSDAPEWKEESCPFGEDQHCCYHLHRWPQLSR